MRDVMPDVEDWWAAGETVGVATVVGTWRSAPRQPGASMAVGPDGSAVGSVSGGCVEGAVYELAEAARADGRSVLQRYGVSDDDAFAVGLTCGGIIDVFVEPVSRDSFPEFGDVTARRRRGPAGRGRHADQWRRRAGRPADGRAPRCQQRLPRQRATRRRRPRRLARHVAARPHWHRPLRRGRRAARRRHRSLRQQLRTPAADAGVRCDRLRRGRRPRRCLPRLPRHGLRRAADLRHQEALPGRRRSRRGLAAQVPRQGRGGRADRHLRAHPRPEVRRAAARDRAAPAGCLRGRHGLPPHQRRPPQATPRERADRGRARPAARADRPGRGRPHAGGDRRLDRRRDHFLTLGRDRIAGCAAPPGRSTTSTRSPS